MMSPVSLSMARCLEIFGCDSLRTPMISQTHSSPASLSSMTIDKRVSSDRFLNNRSEDRLFIRSPLYDEAMVGLAQKMSIIYSIIRMCLIGVMSIDVTSLSGGITGIKHETVYTKERGIILGKVFLKAGEVNLYECDGVASGQLQLTTFANELGTQLSSFMKS